MIFGCRGRRDARAIGQHAAAGALALMASIAATPAAFSQEAAADEGIPEHSIAKSLPQQGDSDGARKALAAKGITYGLNYIGEWQADVAGGKSLGGIYIGRFEGVIDIDLAKLMGWPGLAFHANGFQIHGDGLSRERIGNLMTVSYIEALPATRLSELWLEQRMPGDALSLRFGQLAADTEFAISTYANQFINSTFGWPTILAESLPSGGPAYPFATPGVRVKLDSGKAMSLLLGVFDGDPAGPGDGNPETRNRYGLNFRMQDPPLIILEGQYRYNQEKGSAGLAGSIKLGAWGHLGLFDAQRFVTGGPSRDDLTVIGGLPKHRGNEGAYAVIDQQVWRPTTGEADKGIGVFARVSANPADRNLVDLYVDGGIVLAGLFPWRPDDVLSFGAAYARISSGARQFDADVALLAGAGLIRDFEATLEVNYQAKVVTGWQIDVDLQRIIHPGGGILDAGRAVIPDATVLTLHTVIKY